MNGSFVDLFIGKIGAGEQLDKNFDVKRQIRS